MIHAGGRPAGALLCGIGMGPTLDGTRLPQTVEDDGALGTVLRAALEQFLRTAAPVAQS